MTTHESSTVMVMGISLQPIHVPVAMMILGGSSSVMAGLKGLCVTLAVSKLFEVKRWNGDMAVDWFIGIIKEWNEYINRN
jgi:hypothetical protein